MTHKTIINLYYNYITNTCEVADRSQVDDVWCKHIFSKVSLMVWRLLSNRLPTKQNLVKRGIFLLTDGTCVTGCDDIESATHLFLHCNTFSVLWTLVRSWLGIFSVPSGEFRHHFTQFTKMAGMPRSSHLFFYCDLVRNCLGDLEGAEQPCVPKHDRYSVSSH